MADFVPSTPISEWNALAEKRRELRDAPSKRIRDFPIKQIVEVEDQLLDGHAPDIKGVILKLEILFETFMYQDTQDAFQHLRVIGDLRRLEDELS